MKSTGLPCEICKTRIYLTFKNVQLCLNQDDIKTRIKNNHILFIILLIFETIVIGSLVFIIFFMINSSDSFGKDVISTIIVVCALGFLITAIILTLYYLITRYFIAVKSKL
jgi:hypothetical protein